MSIEAGNEAWVKEASGSASDRSTGSGPFEGVRVLSLAEQYPGPYATLLLADLGADVILVERPGTGDPARMAPAFFASLARNKRSVCLDLKSPDGRRHFLRLVAGADVLVEGFRPGTMARFGLAYDDLKREHERLIYASISGFGQTGPYRDRVAHDFSYQAIAGLLFGQSATNLRPPNVSYADIAGAMFAAFAIATALFARERTGLGTFIDVAMTDALVSWMTVHLGPRMNWAESHRILAEPAYGAFSCSDGKVLTLSIAHEDHFWKLLCRVLDLSAVDALGHEERVWRSEELRGRIQERLALRSSVEWGREFDRYGIPWSPLYDLDEVVEDRHFRERGLFTKVQRSDGSWEAHVRQPVLFGGCSGAVRRPSPALGEHTREILEGDAAGRRS